MTPLLNQFLSSSDGRRLTVAFSHRPFGGFGSHRAEAMYVTGFQEHGGNRIDSATWNAIIKLTDQAVDEFPAISNATTHAARLVFFFTFGKQLEVTSDLRRDYLSSFLGRFSGELRYVDPDSYGVPIEVDGKWNIYPTGMPLALEGELVFDERTLLADIHKAVKDDFNKTVLLGMPTELPVRELQGVPCAFNLMPRFF